MTNIAMLDELQKYVDEMNQSSSSNAKKTVLKRFQANEVVKKLLYYTYNPYLKYGVTSKNVLKNADMADSFGETGWNPDRNIFDLLDSLVTREVTGNAALRDIYAYLFFTQHKYDTLILSILDKDLKTRAGATLINSVIPGLIPTFEVALANSVDGINPKKIDIFDGSWVLSRKLDGVRCVCITDSKGEATFYTREGNKIETLGKLKRAIDSYGLINRVFDGELCLIDSAGNEDFQGIVSEFRKKDHEIENPAYSIFDYLTREEFEAGTSSADRDYWVRYTELKELFRNTVVDACFRYVGQTTLCNAEGLEANKEQAAQLGWEGLMLRKIAPYKAGRSNDLLKVKSFKDDEFEVTGLEVGPFRAVENGKEITLRDVMTNIIIGLVVDGKVYKVSVGTGFTIEERVKYARHPELIVGKRVTVKYFGVSQNKSGDFSLRFPTCKGIRDYE